MPITDRSKVMKSSLLSRFPTADTVPFPHAKPYAQQRALMDALLKSLRPSDEKRTKLLFLESPTGTGKSLSLGCASLAWLKFMEDYDLASSSEEEDNSDDNNNNNEKHKKNNNNKSIPSENDDEWWRASSSSSSNSNEAEARRRCRQVARASRQRLEDRLALIRKKQFSQSRGMAARNECQLVPKRQRQRQRNRKRPRPRVVPKRSNHSADDDDVGVDGYGYGYRSPDSADADGTDSPWVADEDDGTRGVAHPSELLNGHVLDGSCAHPTRPSTGNVHPGSGVRKIVYVARTHSQLSQFVAELRRIPRWGPTIRAVALGSRNRLCANPEVKQHKQRRGDEQSLAEACLDLQSSSSTTTSTSDEKCPFLNKDKTAALALHVLAGPTDIEDLATMGTAAGTCAYYASRESLAAAEVVVAPYNALLSGDTREALGLSLAQSLIIVDEAHNLPEIARHEGQARLPLTTILLSQEALQRYAQRYASRLDPSNLHYVTLLRKCLEGLARFLTTTTPDPNDESQSTTMFTTDELLFRCKLDHVNFFEMDRYLDRSRLAQKLLGFLNSDRVVDGTVLTHEHETKDSSSPTPTQHRRRQRQHQRRHVVSPLTTVRRFLLSLNRRGDDGRVFVSTMNGTGTDQQALQYEYVYVLLDPSMVFARAVKGAYAVALVGGTLRPFAHVATELCGNDSERVDAATVADDKCRRQRNAMANTNTNTNTNMNNPYDKTSPSSSDAKHHTDTVLHESPSSVLTCFTCGHVVPAEHVLLRCVATGPTGRTFDFRHSVRSSSSDDTENTAFALADELGRLLLNRPRRGGMVVFLPTYAYERFLVQRWRHSLPSLIGRLHREPRSRGVGSAVANHEDVWRTYCRDALRSESHHGDDRDHDHDHVQVGPLLTCVVGGKLSEGIDFADYRARCVVVVGLPYPDATDPILREKMAFLDSKRKGNGQTYYRQLCLRAVNQCVGRAIRHSQDYAAILLVDRRYTTDRTVWEGLPAWLTRSGSTTTNTTITEASPGGGRPPPPRPFGRIMYEVKSFLKEREQKDEHKQTRKRMLGNDKRITREDAEHG